MPGRYTNRNTIENTSEMYEKHREERKVKKLKHYTTPNMTYPNPSQISKMNFIEHTWKHGDRYYKLAFEHYGDKKLWWLIAWFNKAPTESHLKMGQTVFIPKPLSSALSYMREVTKR